MGDSFLLVEVSVRKPGAKTYAAGLWHVVKPLTARDALALAKSITTAVLAWHESNVPEGEGQPLFGHRSREVRIHPDRVEWAKTQCGLFPADSPLRFVDATILGLFPQKGA